MLGNVTKVAMNELFMKNTLFKQMINYFFRLIYLFVLIYQEIFLGLFSSS